MAKNNSTETGNVNSNPTVRLINDKVIIVQVLIGVFLYINSLLIFTFFKKEIFRTNTRYIFFAHMLLCDWIFLFVTNILLLMIYFAVTIPAGLCVVICLLMLSLNFATPLTLTAMSLERYVAICMPLRHAEISTLRRAILCILIIHSLSNIHSIIIISIFFASVPLKFYLQDKLCLAEMLIVHRWQSHLRSAISQIYFLVMSSTIAFTYVKIMAAVKVASTDKKKSTSKGRKTVILHAMQLFLCLIQLWCPFVEAAVLQIDFQMYIDLRYFDYITFILASRCLCPLVYGLRDEKFFMALRYYAFCGLNKKITPNIIDM